MNFIKTTIIGGLLFLVPVVALAVVVATVYQYMLKIAKPMAEFIPVDEFGGVAVANLIAGSIILVICFVAGLVAKADPAKRLAGKIEQSILSKIPGYGFVKGMTSTLAPENTGKLQAVLVSLGYSHRVGLEIEKVGSDRVAIYFPGSPNAYSGEVLIVDEGQVERLNQPMTAAIDHAERLGRGSHDMLSRSP
jgi:uncharacterized membrane protein